MSIGPFLRRLHYTVDESCSALVSATVIGVNLYSLVAYPQCVVVPFLTAACCVTAALSKVLKRIINQARPAGAPKLNPGMPSNHATSLSFLAMVAAYGITPFFSEPNDVRLRVCQVALMGYAAYAIALRVYCGHHTWPQVLVGTALGVIAAEITLRLNFMPWGDTELPAGGRVETLPPSVKQWVLVGCVTTGVLAFSAILKGSPLVAKLSRKRRE